MTGTVCLKPPSSGGAAGRTLGAGHAGRARQAQDASASCGQLLQRYRMLAGLTQEKLAARAGYSANYIGKLEQDRRELPAAALDRLAAVLGLAGQEQAALRQARERAAGATAGRRAGHRQDTAA